MSFSNIYVTLRVFYRPSSSSASKLGSMSPLTIWMPAALRMALASPPLSETARDLAEVVDLPAWERARSDDRATVELGGV